MAVTINKESMKVTCECGNVQRFNIPSVQNFLSASVINTEIACPACDGKIAIRAEVPEATVTGSYTPAEG